MCTISTLVSSTAMIVSPLIESAWGRSRTGPTPSGCIAVTGDLQAPLAGDFLGNLAHRLASAVAVLGAALCRCAIGAVDGVGEVNAGPSPDLKVHDLYSLAR